jgi:N-acetylglutamate synthase-like GNAT family acetyltransferase
MKLSDKGIIIQDTTEEDLPQIYAAGIKEPAFQNIPFAFNAENLADIFASDKSIIYSAVRKKKVLGFIAGSINGSESIIRWIMVKENLRKSGIGKELFKLYMDRSEKFEASEYSITITEDKTGALTFLKNNGFKISETLIKLKIDSK